MPVTLPNLRLYHVAGISFLAWCSLKATVVMADASQGNRVLIEEGRTRLTSTGESIYLQKADFSLTPPVGWEVRADYPRLSLIIQEPEQKIETQTVSDRKGKRQIVQENLEPKFRRNITVAFLNQASPIDEGRTESLKKELHESFGRDGSLTDFQILEHKFFDYKQKRDGILAFTSFNMDGEAMMQLHVLVSGAEKQYLLTYTDFAKGFKESSAQFQSAWTAMMSIQVSGLAPSRYAHLWYWAAGGMMMLLSTMLYVLWRKRKNREITEFDESSLSSSDDSVGEHPFVTNVSGVWLLNGKQQEVSSISAVNDWSIASNQTDSSKDHVSDEWHFSNLQSLNDGSKDDVNSLPPISQVSNFA